MGNYKYTDLSGVLTAAILQLLIFSIAIFAFSHFRPKKREIYLKKDLNAQTGSYMFEWYATIWAVKEPEMIERMGMDGYILILFFEFSANLFGILTFFAFPLCALNYFAPRIDTETWEKVRDDPSADILSLTTLTMSNLASRSKLYYVHTALAYMFSFVIFYMLYSLWVKFGVLRQRYFNSKEFNGRLESKTLMITQVGNDLLQSSKMDKFLRKECGLSFKPNSVIIGKDQKLDQLVAKHLTLIVKLEKVLVKYLGAFPTPESKPTHREPMIFGSKVDSISFYTAKLNEIERKIYDIISSDTMNLNHSAFVTFNSVKQNHAACRQITIPKSRNMRFRPSPAFNDIIWDNIGVDVLLKKSRKLVATGLTCGLIIGWVFLNIFVAAVAGSLVTKAPLPPSLIVFLQSVVTPVCNAVMIILLPIFLRKIARLQCVSSISGVEKSALYKFFVFQIYQFITQIAASLLFNILSDFSKISDIDYIITTLSTAFNAQSTYFITFLVTGYTGYGVALIQIAPLLIQPIMKKYFSTTPRDDQNLNAVQKIDYLAGYGFLLLTMMLGISYSVVSPLIIPFTALLFFLGLISFRYLLLFVIETEFETGGSWFYKIFNMVLGNVAIFQISTFISIFSLSARSKTTASMVNSALALLLPFLTLFFWIFMEYSVKPKTLYVSSSSMAIESSESDDANTEILNEFSALNPITAKELPRVWLPDEMIERGSKLYSPKFENFRDFEQKMTLNSSPNEEPRMVVV